MKVPLEKQSFNWNSTLGLVMGTDADLKDDKPRDVIDLYLIDSCAVN